MYGFLKCVIVLSEWPVSSNWHMGIMLSFCVESKLVVRLSSNRNSINCKREQKISERKIALQFFGMEILRLGVESDASNDSLFRVVPYITLQ